MFYFFEFIIKLNKVRKVKVKNMTSSRLSGNSLYAQAISGLQASYGYLMQGVQGGGLTLQNIVNPTDEAKKTANLNYNFSQYLASNFSSIDMDGDGIISESDLSQYTSNLSASGLTYNQLVQLCSQGTTNSLLETVLNNFSEIDANGDGRVTSAEISGYGINKELEEVKEKYPKVDPEQMSMFYTTTKSTTSIKDEN